MPNYCVLTLSKFHDQLDRMLHSLQLCQPNLSLSDIYVVDDGLDPSIREIWKVNYIQGGKPFCFSRNFNIGVKALPKDKDVFFLGDDVVMVTSKGIDILAELVQSLNWAGLASPIITGGVRNPYQKAGILSQTTSRKQLETLPYFLPTLMFVAVYIKREALELVGPISERLIGYGFEDDYFCNRMIKGGLDWLIEPKVHVFHGWNQHTSATSYHRSGQNPAKLLELNKGIYDKLSE